jgi:hypothetical protein
MSVRELRCVVTDYLTSFPSWNLWRGQCIVRESRPLLQQIGFERLRTGAYRPSSAIRILCAPDSAAFPQFLSIKYQSIYPKNHARMRDGVIEAMKREFVPSIVEPLVPTDVLQLYESQEIIKSHDAHALAGFNAYLGRWDRALYWCGEFPKLVEMLGHGWESWDRERGEFLRLLEKKIVSGAASEWLDGVISQERRRLGLE